MDYARYAQYAPRGPGITPIPALNGYCGSCRGSRFADAPSAVVAGAAVQEMWAPQIAPTTPSAADWARAMGAPGAQPRPSNTKALLGFGAVGLFLWWMSSR